MRNKKIKVVLKNGAYCFRPLVHYGTYSVKKMAVQDNDQGAGLLVDLDLNALSSLEVDLEAAGPLEEPPMVVAL